MIADLEVLRAAVCEQYPVSVASIEPLKLGNDPHSRVFKVEDAHGAAFFLKWRRQVSAGVLLSSWLYGSGIAEVLSPLPTASGEVSGSFGGGALLLYRFVAGEHAMERPLNREKWRALGVAVKRVHQAQLPASLKAALPMENFTVERLSQVIALLEDLDESGGDLRRRLAQTLSSRSPQIRQLAERVKGLRAKFLTRELEMVPCHSDLHAYNILTSGASLHIIDWDTPRIAPRECDLQFVCGGGIFGAHGDEEEQAFFSGYGAYSPDLEVLSYFRAARVLEDVVAYADEALDEAIELERRWDAVSGLERCFG